MAGVFWGRAARQSDEIQSLRAQLSELQAQLGQRQALIEQQQSTSKREIQVALEASEQKSRFLAAASHDLRQPIHAITLFVAALATEPLQGRTKYLVDRLHRSLAGLDELFNRLLDISRLDTGAIEPRMAAFPITQLLQSLEDRFSQLADSRNIKFRVRLNTAQNVHSDPTLLIEIVMNLLSNAFRYTERGGVLLATRRRGDRVMIQIWDTGAGIAADNLELIFREFVQLDNPSRDRRKGLGLGLAIVRRLAHELAHPINVRSRPGRGSVFEISVPISDQLPALNETLTGTGPMADLTGMMILAVDDEIEVLLAMEAILSSWGCFVLLARSIAEALTRLADCERFPDVLLTDHALADGVTSVDIIAAIRQAVPIEMSIAVISGDASAQLASQVTSNGWAFMSKPINPARLHQFLSAAR